MPKCMFIEISINATHKIGDLALQFLSFSTNIYHAMVTKTQVHCVTYTIEAIVVRDNVVN